MTRAQSASLAAGREVAVEVESRPRGSFFFFFMVAFRPKSRLAVARTMAFCGHLQTTARIQGKPSVPINSGPLDVKVAGAKITVPTPSSLPPLGPSALPPISCCVRRVALSALTTTLVSYRGGPFVQAHRG